MDTNVTTEVTLTPDEIQALMAKVAAESAEAPAQVVVTQVQTADETTGELKQ